MSNIILHQRRTLLEYIIAIAILGSISSCNHHDWIKKINEYVEKEYDGLELYSDHDWAEYVNNPLNHVYSIRDFKSPNLLILGTYDSLIAKLGYPDTSYIGDAIPTERDINSHVEYLQYSSNQLTYFRKGDSIQLYSIRFFNKNNYTIYNDSICFNNQLNQKSLCEMLNIDDSSFWEYHYPPDEKRFENDTVAWVLWLKTKKMNESCMSIMFNQSGKLYFLLLGTDNYGIR